MVAQPANKNKIKVLNNKQQLLLDMIGGGRWIINCSYSWQKQLLLQTVQGFQDPLK